MSDVPTIGRIGGLEELTRPAAGSARGAGAAFADSLKEAIRTVDELQHRSEAAQIDYARGAEVDLHEVLIRVEEAEIAFRTMMEVRNKLVDAYREIMRLGSNG